MGQHRMQPARPLREKPRVGGGPQAQVPPWSQGQGSGASPAGFPSRAFLRLPPHPGPSTSAPATGIVFSVFS